MWRSISLSSFGSKRNSSADLAGTCHDSDDGTSSNASSTDEGLECPICWESFNIVENVPYVLWCGHTLCKNCVMGLRCAALKCSAHHQVKIPFFVSCPWCNLLTFRLVYRENLRFPSKNFFLLWMVESRNGDRVKSPSLISGESVGNTSLSNNRNHNNDTQSQSTNMSFHKSLDLLIRVTTKFPLIILFLIIIMFVVPTCAGILLLYLVITVLFAIPAFLVLYFTYPALDWFGREMRR